jgi:hypothetical protein
MYVTHATFAHFLGAPLPGVGGATFASYIKINFHLCGLFNIVTLMLTKSFCYIHYLL